MTERANFQKNYLMRYAALSGVCLLLGLWFAYDGFIGYPSKIPMAAAYDEIRDLPAEERTDKWLAITEEKGWAADIPEKSAEDIRSDITGQYFWALLNAVVGLPALILLIRSRGRWVERTEDGIKTSWGQSFKFSEVTRLNKKRWANKGIARATIEGSGQKGTFVFDDFKYEREPLGKMLRALEDVLQPDQIVGGPSEKEADAERARRAAEEGESKDAGADLHEPESSASND